MASASVIEAGRPAVGRRSLLSGLRGGLQGSEYAWAIAFCIPYVGGVHRLCRSSPCLYGLWLGHKPSLYVELFNDPIYQETVVNTILYLVDRRQREDVLRAAAVGLLHAQGLVGQRPVDDLRAALGGAGAAHLHLDPLDAQHPVGPDQQRAVGRFPHRRSGLARYLALAGARLGHRLLHLEEHAVLDGDPAGRPDGDPAGALRGGRGRRRDRHPAVRPCEPPAARQSLSGVHAALDDLHARRFQHGLFHLGRRPGAVDACAGDARHSRRV